MSAASVVRLLSQSKYRHQDQAKSQIVSAMKQYRALAPQQEIYTYPNGVSQEMVVLSGTIPVSYKRTTYNIPVAFYLPVDFPMSGPICYVKPTADMMIKQSQNIDGSGRVYFPYLSDWSHTTSDLLGVIQVMIITFSEAPPVYQRPKSSPYASDNSPYPKQRKHIQSITIYSVQ
jgi:ESCRT-I complex subunit TSG101